MYHTGVKNPIFKEICSSEIARGQFAKKSFKLKVTIEMQQLHYKQDERAKIDKFHTDCFFIGPTWAGERICPNLKSDLAAKDPGLQCALSTTPASSEI